MAASPPRVGARQYPPADNRILGLKCRLHTFKRDGELHVAELADIILCAVITGHPTQEHIAGRLHQALPYNESLMIAVEFALSSIRLHIPMGEAFLTCRNKGSSLPASRKR